MVSASKKSPKSQTPPDSPVGIEVHPDRFYSIAECCQIVGCRRSTLYSYVLERGFPVSTAGRRQAYGADIIAWMREQTKHRAKPRRKGQASTS